MVHSTPNRGRSPNVSPVVPADEAPTVRHPVPAVTDLPALLGRARELALLREHLDGAAAGRGGIVAIGGEPGIGKTRLAQAAAALALAADFTVLWGRCHEGIWAPPYGPWVELLAALLDEADPDRLRADLAGLGAGADALATLQPAFLSFRDETTAPVPLPPDEERFRRHDAAARFLLLTARSRPLLIVLDDLQWADRPSLALLQHLARLLSLGLHQTRLVVVATYRDGALDRDHPLTEALAALRREAGFVPIGLKGLEPAAVVDLVEQLARRQVGPELGRAIHGETAGNPFYIREVTRHLLDEGALVERDTVSTVGGVRALGVPEGIRQVVGRRLARLSEPTRRLLEQAAVFTAGVDFSVLQALTGLPEDDLLDALDEALAAQLLRPADGRRETYDFTHAIVRQALVAEWERNPSRAARLHRRAAEALELVHGQRGQAAAELAIQFHASAALPGAARGVPYALAAAEQARAAFAREQTVAFLRIARDLADDLDAGSRGSILCKLATAEAEALLLGEAEATTQAALAALAAGEAAPERVAAFLASLAAALAAVGADGSLWRPLVERGLALVGDDHGLTWARLMLLRDPVDPFAEQVLRAGRWRGFAPEAVRIARLLGDEDDHARTFDSFDARTRPETDALLALGRSWTRPSAVLRALTVAANDLQYRHGAFRQALAVWQEVQTAAERYGAVSWQAQALNQLTLLQVALGDFAAACAAEAGAIALIARLGPQGGGAGEAEALAAERETSFALYLDGDWDAIARFWTRCLMPAGGGNYVTTLNGPFFAAMAALAHAQAGDAAEVHDLLDALLPVLAALDPAAENQAQNGSVALAADAVWILDAAGALREPGRFAGALHRLARDLIAAGVGDYPQTSNELTVARMAALRGDLGEARDSFARARTVLDASGQRPLRAIVDHDEAVALLRRAAGEQATAAALLEAARAAFRELGMDGWASRTQIALDGLAPGRPLYPAGLSEREAEVVRLVARGYSDRQIADDLFVSPRTVNAHVRNLLTKTDRGNRTELSVWAVEHGLVGPADQR